MIPAPVGYQCPDCVEEARREFRRGPGRRAAVRGVTATKVLLVALLVGFLLETLTGGPTALLGGPSRERLLDMGALQPLYIADGQYWRLLTAIFLHAGLLHIAFNSYALWLFGAIVESTFGRTRFLLIYFVSGFLASVASYTFGNVFAIGVGASGAIFGVFGAFVAHNWRRRHLAHAAANLRTAMTLIVLNAFLAFTFAGIDWRAHLGGLVSGVAAGFVAEGFGPARQRAAVAALGFAGMIAAGVALAAWRTAEIRALAGF